MTHAIKTRTLLVSASLALMAPLAFAQDPASNAQADGAAAGQVNTAHDQARESQAASPASPATPATPPTGEATQAEPATPATPAQPAAASNGEKTWADLDGDGNGTLNASEAASMPSLAKVFGEADANADGELSADEYRAWFAANQPATPTTGKDE